MAVLTVPQIAQLASNVGIPGGETMFTCCAIALAESSGRTDAVNQNSDGSTDKGEWQINTVHDDKLPGADRFDPNVNAQLMAMISSNGTDWSPWSTYNNGAYLAHMGEVMQAIGGSTFVPNGAGGAGSGAGNGLVVENAQLAVDAQNVDNKSGSSAISKFFQVITTTDGWFRILKVGVGIVVIIVALLLLFASTDTGKAAIKTGSKVAEVAALA